MLKAAVIARESAINPVTAFGAQPRGWMPAFAGMTTFFEKFIIWLAKGRNRWLNPGYDCVQPPKSVGRAENFERLRSEVAADRAIIVTCASCL